MIVGLAQINPTLGCFSSNKDKILQYIVSAREKKCDLVVFPECCLIGYHPFDLLERTELVDQQNKALKQIIQQIPAGIAVLIGVLSKNSAKKGKPYFNSAVLLQKNKILKSFHKQLLPTEDVFDEARFIEAGDLKNNFFKYKNKNFFVTICEDIWAWPKKNGRSSYRTNPINKVPRKKVDLVINLSASPYFLEKLKLRESNVLQTARYFKAPMAYVNLVGGQDEIIFDGQSFLVDSNGKKKLLANAFAEQLSVFDLASLKSEQRKTRRSKIEELKAALVLGIKDFVEKNKFPGVHLGLSGGIDSALVACLAVDAVGKDKVKTLALPGPYSSPLSLDLAFKLAKNLEIEISDVPILDVYQSILHALEDKIGLSDFGVVHENLQARIRGILLMAFANKTNSLLLTTGNKSELSTGYCTLYGDMCGGLAPIADLTKRQVYQLCDHYNKNFELIPKEIIDRAPSAELRPGQKDQDTLPQYDLLDHSVESIVQNFSKAKTKTDFWLIDRLLKTEFKRWQAPPILKVTAHSFGRGRRYPITHQFKIVLEK